MSRIQQTGAIVCGILSGVCIIVALSSTSWITTCFPLSDAMNVGQHQSSNSEHINEQLKGLQACLDLGLFEITMSVPGVANTKIKATTEAFAQATAGLLIVGLLLIFPAVLLMGLAACSASKNSFRVSSAFNYQRIGFALITFANFVVCIGMLVYTILQAPTVHNSPKFMLQVGSAITKSMGAISGGGVQNAMGSIPNNPSGRSQYLESHSSNMNPENFPDWSQMKSDSGSSRRKRQSSSSTTDSPSYGMPIDGDNSSDYPIGDNLPPVSGHLDPVDYSYSHSGPNVPDMKSIMKLFDPTLGYSFYFGWLGAFLSLIGAVMGGLAYVSMRKDDIMDQRVPMV